MASGSRSRSPISRRKTSGIASGSRSKSPVGGIGSRSKSPVGGIGSRSKSPVGAGAKNQEKLSYNFLRKEASKHYATKKNREKNGLDLLKRIRAESEGERRLNYYITFISNVEGEIELRKTFALQAYQLLADGRDRKDEPTSRRTDKDLFTLKLLQNNLPNEELLSTLLLLENVNFDGRLLFDLIFHSNSQWKDGEIEGFRPKVLGRQLFSKSTVAAALDFFSLLKGKSREVIGKIFDGVDCFPKGYLKPEMYYKLDFHLGRLCREICKIEGLQIPTCFQDDSR